MNREVENLLERYDRSIAEVETNAIKRVNRALNKSFRELVKELRPIYKDVAPNLSLLPNQRKLLIVNQIKDLLKVVRPDARGRYEGIFNNLLEESEDFGVDMSSELLNLLEGEEFALTRSTARLPIEALTLAAQDSVNRLIRHGETFASRATGVIEQGIIRGWGNQKLSRLLMGELNIVKSRADRIARTETNSVFNQAAQNNYNRNGFKYVQIYATADRRLCPYCGARFGNVYELGKITVPFHVSCRCVLVPFRKSWYEEKTLSLKGVRGLRKEAIAEMKARGIKSNFGVAPFERAAGLTEAPKPVWKPSENIEKMPPSSSKVRPPTSLNQEIKKFPDRLDQLELVRELGGSTGAQLYKNPITGQQYVLKGGRNETHIKTEMLADSLYLANGVKVPEFRSYRDSEGNLVKLAEYIQGRSLEEFLNQATDLEINQVKKQLQQNFGIDALLGNWDVAGLTNDNIIVDSDLVAWRIDNGGSLDRRATGLKKNSAQWNEYADELWSMRDPNINRSASDIFGSMSWAEVIASAKKIDREKILNAIDDDQLKSDLMSRLDKLQDLVRVNDVMSADKFKMSYLDDFSKHYYQLQRELLDVLPKKMINIPSKYNDTKLVDENGKLFDNFRDVDENSIQVKIEKYIDQIGDFNVIKSWAREQSSDSWAKEPVSYKYFLYSQAREVDFDSFFWKGSSENKAKSKYKSTLNGLNVNQEIYRQSFTAFHVFNYLIVSKVDLPNNIKNKKAIRLLRTESDDVMDLYNPNRETGIRPVMKRGMAESTSIVRHVVVQGSHLTYQEVPYHRILGTYLIERGTYNQKVKKTLYESFFLTDAENEVIAMLDGLPHEYAGKIDRDREGDEPFIKPVMQ